MFGKQRNGAENPMFGKRKEKCQHYKGRRVRPDGYVIVTAPDDHPYPCDVKASGLKRVLEHRLVMEQHIGRYLEPHEVVHHIDENPSNNHISNLQLFQSQAEHNRVGHPHKRKVIPQA